MRLTFTGIRDVPNDVELMRRLHDSVEDHINRGFNRFSTSLLGESDIWFMRSVIRHKIEHPNIKLIFYKSHQGFREEYEKNFDQVILVSDLPYAEFIVTKCVEQMVNESDAVLSIYDFEESDSTYSTIKYTNKLEKPITIIKV